MRERWRGCRRRVGGRLRERWRGVVGRVGRWRGIEGELEGGVA